MKKWKTLLVMMIILLLITTHTVSAEDENKTFNRNEAEVVFLLDTSGSMNTYDKTHLAVDTIRQAAYSLPSGYKVGLVAYNTGIQTIIPFNTGPEQMETQLESITYSGYTNAGEGLSRAVELFTDRKGMNRYIVMLTDGEIDMPDKQAKELSRTLYTNASKKAGEKGIKICIVAVGSELNDPRMHIFDGAELTDGTIYWEGQSGSLVHIMDRIISDRFGFPRKSVGVTDSNGGGIHVEVPKGASRLKLLITDPGGIVEVKAEYAAESGKTITGQHFAVVDMSRPDSESIDVHFLVSDISKVQAYLLTEFEATPQVLAEYRSIEQPRTEDEVKKNVPPSYLHFADLTIQMADKGGENDNLWSRAEYEGRQIAYIINGERYTGTLQNGQLHHTMAADGIDTVEVSVDIRGVESPPHQRLADGVEEIYYVDQPVSAAIDKIPDPIFVPSADYRPLWAILGILALVVLTLTAFLIKKSRSTLITVAQPPASKEPVKKLETRSCTYSGKFNLYVVRTESGRDIPPQTFRLFGHQGGRMTLNKILTSCGIKLGNIGGDDIILYPGPDQSVIIMDQSEGCTVLRGTEILKKGMGYPVYYNEKLTVSFDDEATEMELHYKNLKPSERGG